MNIAALEHQSFVISALPDDAMLLQIHGCFYQTATLQIIHLSLPKSMESRCCQISSDTQPRPSIYS
jgi:hypothetical protein